MTIWIIPAVVWGIAIGIMIGQAVASAGWKRSFAALVGEIDRGTLDMHKSCVRVYGECVRPGCTICPSPAEQQAGKL